MLRIIFFPHLLQILVGRLHKDLQWDSKTFLRITEHRGRKEINQELQIKRNLFDVVSLRGI